MTFRTAGASLAIDPHTGELLLHRLLDAQETSVDTFAQALEAMVRAVVPLGRMLANPQEATRDRVPARPTAAVPVFDVLALRV